MQIHPTPEQQEIIAALGAIRALLDCFRPVVERIFEQRRKQREKRTPTPDQEAEMMATRQISQRGNLQLELFDNSYRQRIHDTDNQMVTLSTMQVVSVLSEKGGAGKTTLSVHLAVAAQLAGLDAVIIDLDPQASAADWSDRRGSAPEAVAIPPVRLGKLLGELRRTGFISR